MPEQPFMLVSLEEAKAKKLAQVLGNETCTKVLNWLSANKEGTESEIATKLKLPLSTVHYNLKQLVEARLVTANEYHYSEKGREVNHYKLANKYIIIAPQEEQQGFLDKLQQFLPAALIVAGVGVVLKVLNLLTGTARFTAGGAEVESFAMEAAIMPQAAPLAAEMVEESADAAAGSLLAERSTDGATAAMYGWANESAKSAAFDTLPSCPGGQSIVEGGCVVTDQFLAEPIRQQLFSNMIILAFVVGGFFAIFLIALFTYLRKRKK